MNIKKIIKDVRGAALVYVIVAAALIVMLGAATTATAYVNLRATQVQEKSDNNFYSADTVMNAIVSGLENDISTAYETAYTKVITNLNTYPSLDDARDDFDALFLNSLDSLLNDGAESFSFYYSAEHIQGYVQAVFEDDIRYTVTALNGDNYLDMLEDGLMLRNLHVTYEDDTGYFDEITTDIKIAIPEFHPEHIQKAELQLNAFVVDNGLEIDFSKGLQINGDAYINERESDHNAILLNDKTSLSIISPLELIAGGHIITKDDTNLTFKGKDELSNKSNFIWTENMDFGRYTIADIHGQTFVYDDMEINGMYSEVTLAGEYYGYSQSATDVDESSSINVNGAHTKLDIQELDMLVLAGSSYISTSTVTPGNDRYSNSTDIQLGEALSVKSNQIAYLVDDKEFTQADVKDFVSNPMSYAQYEALVSSNTNWSEAARKMLNKELSYGKSYAEYGATIVPVFSNRDNGTVYLYLNFANPDDAAEYFVDAYKGNTLLSQRLRTYAAQYITSLKLNTDAALLVNENYIDQSVALYTEDNLPTFTDGLGYEQTKPDQTAMNGVLNKLREDYLGDGTIDGEGEKYKVLYSKLINEDQFKAFISKATAADSYTDHHTDSQMEVVDNGVILTGTNGAKAILIDNMGKEPYELGTGKGLVIVSGDLHITGDWLGTIIVGGRAYCKEGAQNAPLDITVDDMTVRSVLPLYFTLEVGGTSESMSVVNVFNGYEFVGVNNATSDHGINADMISACLSFTNWNKH